MRRSAWVRVLLLIASLHCCGILADPPPPDWYQVNVDGFIPGRGPTDEGTGLLVFDARLFAFNDQGLFRMESAAARRWTRLAPPAPPSGPGTNAAWRVLGDYLYAWRSDTRQLWWIAAGSDPGGTSWQAVTSVGLPGGVSPSPFVRFNSKMYGVHLTGSGTFEIWRTGNLGAGTANWEQVVANGFGDPSNNASVDVMIEFNGTICVGTDTLRGIFGNPAHFGSGVEIWQSPSGNAGSWSQVNVDGFGTKYPGCLNTDCNFAIHQVIGCAAVYRPPGAAQDYLYVGTKAHFGAEIWRYDGSGVGGWVNVSPPWSNPGGITDYFRVMGLAVFEGSLYEAEGYPSGALTRYDGTTWSVVLPPPPFGDADNGGLASARVYGNRLYTGTLHAPFVGCTQGDQVWAYPLTANRWTKPSDGWWELGSNWSAGSPGTNQVCRITNAVTKTVTLISFLNNPPGASALTVDSLLVDAPAGDTNTFLVTTLHEGPLRIVDGFRVGPGGAWVLRANATQEVASACLNGLEVDGSARVEGGLLIATNGPLHIGCAGAGRMTVGGGAWLGHDVFVGAEDGASGTLTVTGGTVLVNWRLAIGAEASATGLLAVSGGTLAVASATGPAGIVVGLPGRGELRLDGGTLVADQLYAINGADSVLALNDGFLGSHLTWVNNGQNIVVGNHGGSATLDLLDNTHIFAHGLTAGGSAGSAGTIRASDCSLDASGGIVRIGDYGAGRLEISSATAKAGTLQVGWWPGAHGTVEIAGGELHVGQWVSLGDDTSTTGTLTITDGGLLTVSNDTLVIGGRFAAGYGLLTLSSGTVRARDVRLGPEPSAAGELVVAGGTFAADDRVTLGNPSCTGHGTVEVGGTGAFLLSNAAHDATLDVLSGLFRQSGGQVVIDRLVVTNACGHFVRTGGTLGVGQLVLDAALDADDDGLLNGWEQQYGLDPLSPAGQYGADGDPDGDGMSNGDEQDAGTVPTNPLSLLRITGIARASNAVSVTWTTVGGKSYVLQGNTAPDPGGFGDCSPVIAVPGTGESTTAWQDSSVVCNLVDRCYRVRLEP